MVTLNHIKHKPKWSNVSPSILNSGDMYQPAQLMQMIVMKFNFATYKEHHPQQLTLFLDSIKWEDAPPDDFLLPW